MLLAGFRWLHVAALLSLTGALTFQVWVAGPVLRKQAAGSGDFHRSVRWIALTSLLTAIVAGAAWFVAEAANIGGTSNLSDTLGALAPVAFETQFGNVMLARCALLLIASVLIGRLDPAAWLLSALALVLQSEIGHAGAASGWIGVSLLGSETFHLLAAAAWLGALLPLMRTLSILPPSNAAAIVRRFSPLGMAAVMLLAGSGLFQGLTLIGTFPGLVGTPYGQAATTKIALFGLMLVLAIYNRLTLTDRLAGTDWAAARRALRRSIGAEIVMGGLLISAAATMASLTPALHEQPDWPFAWRPSLAVMEDPDLRHEVMTALLSTGAALIALFVALIWRRFRIVAALVLAGVLAYRLSSLELLLVEAYPTSFYTSPSGFSAASIVQGQALFPTYCSSCHGPHGGGDGPAAAALRIKPADLTAAHLLEHSDGELFWWLSHGIDDPDGGLAMPGFADQLSEDQRWALIDFIRANNAGFALRTEGHWRQPSQAPDFPITCSGSPVASVADLRGRMLEVIADAGGTPLAEPSPDTDATPITTLHLSERGGAADCSAETPDAWQAYAILAGVAPQALAKSRFLVDPAGWLRVARIGPQGHDWDRPQVLDREVQSILANPILQSSGGAHAHHH
jgi:putative copper export protein/mono/diheme cytochrome c family protein